MENFNQASPKKSGEKVDSATSTPGPQVRPSLTRQRDSLDSPARIVKSELSESEESAVFSSPGDNTLEQTTVYEQPEEDTTLQDLTAENSCVASRTRSKSISAEMNEILFNIKELMSNVEKEENPQEDQEEEEFELLTSNLESLPLPTAKGAPEANRQLMKSLKKLQSSITVMADQGDDINQEETILLYSDLSKSLLDRTKEIELPITCLEVPEEFNRILGLTFIKDKNKSNKALRDTLQALQLLSYVDLQEIPRKNLENIVRLIIAICNDCNQRLTTCYDIIARFDHDITNMVNVNQKLEAIDKQKKSIEDEMRMMREDNDEKMNQIIELQDRINKQLEQAVGSLDGNVVHAQLIDMERRKNDYKKQYLEAQNRLEFNKKTLDRKEGELHSAGKEITRLREESIQATDKCNEAQDNHISALQEISDLKEHSLRQEEERRKEIEYHRKINSEQADKIIKLTEDASK